MDLALGLFQGLSVTFQVYLGGHDGRVGFIGCDALFRLLTRALSRLMPRRLLRLATIHRIFSCLGHRGGRNNWDWTVYFRIQAADALRLIVGL